MAWWTAFRIVDGKLEIEDEFNSLTDEDIHAFNVGNYQERTTGQTVTGFPNLIYKKGKHRK